MPKRFFGRVEMAESDEPTYPKRQNAYTGMMMLSFIAISIGCLILALDLYLPGGLPLKPEKDNPASTTDD